MLDGGMGKGNRAMKGWGFATHRARGWLVWMVGVDECVCVWCEGEGSGAREGGARKTLTGGYKHLPFVPSYNCTPRLRTARSFPSRCIIAQHNA